MCRSTTRDQWAGDVETASVSSGEGSEWEERSGGETGDHDGDPTHGMKWFFLFSCV